MEQFHSGEACRLGQRLAPDLRTGFGSVGRRKPGQADYGVYQFK
jgi:hypothetical protein